jgi:maleylacetate reductase
MTDPATRRKEGAGGPTVAPVAAVYDPELTVSTPARVSAETGMNALAHCVEAVWSPTRTPEAEGIALAGAVRIVDALPRVVDDPADLGARGAMLTGAALAGRCLQNASMGVHHGLAQMVGGRTGIAHGLANAVILPRAMAFNADAVPDAIAALGRALGTDDPVGLVAGLLPRLGLPPSLARCGVSRDDVEAIAALAPSNRNVVNNPKPVTVEDALAILTP